MESLDFTRVALRVAVGMCVTVMLWFRRCRDAHRGSLSGCSSGPPTVLRGFDFSLSLFSRGFVSHRTPNKRERIPTVSEHIEKVRVF